MAKASKKSTPTKPVAKKAAVKASPKLGHFRGAKVLGVTDDGVKILQGKRGKSNFTAKEIRMAVASVRAARNEQ